MNSSVFRLGDPIADPASRLGRCRNFCGKVVNSTVARCLLVVVLILDMIVVGAGLSNEKLWVVESVLLILFTVESFLQTFYLGFSMFSNSPWIVYDAAVVVVAWFFSGFTIFRSLDLIHLASNMTGWAPLRMLGRGLRNAFYPLSVLMGFFLLSIYAAAVLFTYLFADMYELGYTSDNYFGSLGRSFLTLFQIATLDGWSDVVREVAAVYPWAWIPFILFVLVVYMVTVLAFAVVCRSLIQYPDTATVHSDDDEGLPLKSSDNDPEASKEEQQTLSLRSDIEVGARVVDKQQLPMASCDQLQLQILANQKAMQEALLLMVVSSSTGEEQKQRIELALSRVSASN